MKLMNRVQKLERSEVLSGLRPLLERYERALDDAAFTVSGKSLDGILEDPSLLDQAFAVLAESFIQKLSDADLEALDTEIKRIASEMAPLPSNTQSERSSG